jgi:soluble lytic murein transglycosylase-like protein
MEKLLQMIQAMLQNAMQRPGENGEGQGGAARKGPAHTHAPTAEAGGIEGISVGGASLVLNTALAQNVSPAKGAAGTRGAGGLHLPTALTKHEEAIGRAADASGMPAKVIIAGMIWAESRGDSSAGTLNSGNGKSDSGLMQVNSATAAEVQSKYPQHFTDTMTFEEKNIMTGALYLKDQSKTFGGDMNAALRAYNSGPGTVNVDNPSDISKTGLGDSNYITKVNNFAEIIGSGKGRLPA